MVRRAYCVRTSSSAKRVANIPAQQGKRGLLRWLSRQAHLSHLVAGRSAAPNVCGKIDQRGNDEGVFTGLTEGLKRNGCRCELEEER